MSESCWEEMNGVLGFDHPEDDIGDQNTLG